MIRTTIPRLLISFSALIWLGSLATVQAGLVFVNEADGTHEPVFYLDSGDASTDFIDLEFGTTLDAKLRYDIANNVFSLNRDTDFGGNEIQNVKFESSAAEPVACDGTQAGRVYYNTTDSATYICNSSSWEVIENSAVAFNADLKAAVYRESLGTNINAAATDNVIPWNIEDFEDNAYTHDTVTNNSRIPVTTTGRYMVSGALSVINTTTNNFRYNGRVKFRLNGTTVLEPRFQPGYIRRAGGHDETSLVFSLILDLTAGDYFEILVDRESNSGGPATMIANQSSLSIVQLKVPVDEAVVAPFISSTVFNVSTSTTETISIVGTGFLPTSTVSLPGFPGTVNSTTIVSPTQIDVSITTTGTEAAYDVVVDNSGVDNTFWTGNGVGLVNVELITGTGVAGTYTESFEAGLGSWVSSGLSADWTIDSGGTPSGGTGPTVASAGTFYLYTEASGANNPNVPFGIETTDFRVAQSVSFDYHMFGGGMGTLEVQTLRSGVWTTRFTLSGQQQGAQGDAYVNQFVDLSSFQVEGIRFVGTSGATFASDITIDNVIIIST